MQKVVFDEVDAAMIGQHLSTNVRRERANICQYFQVLVGYRLSREKGLVSSIASSRYRLYLSVINMLAAVTFSDVLYLIFLFS